MFKASRDFTGRSSGDDGVGKVQLDDAIDAIKSSDESKVKRFDKTFIGGALFPCAKC